MRAVCQRVSRASVTVDGEVVGEIGVGWLVLLGVGPNDDEATAARMADKIVGLRVFEDEAGKMNRSVVDVGGDDTGGLPVHAVRRHLARTAAGLYWRSAAGRCRAAGGALRGAGAAIADCGSQIGRFGATWPSS